MCCHDCLVGGAILDKNAIIFVLNLSPTLTNALAKISTSGVCAYIYDEFNIHIYIFIYIYICTVAIVIIIISILSLFMTDETRLSCVCVSSEWQAVYWCPQDVWIEFAYVKPSAKWKKMVYNSCCYLYCIRVDKVSCWPIDDRGTLMGYDMALCQEGMGSLAGTVGKD